MQNVPLNGKYGKGLFTLIDDEDYTKVEQYKWAVTKTGYVRVRIRNPDNKKKHIGIWLHRLVMNCPPEKKIDHINRDLLDNRKCNLRFATPSQNQSNRRKPKNNTSGYKGVKFDPYYYCNERRFSRTKPYRAIIYKEGKQYSSGSYKSALEAAMAYDKKAIELFGEFASTNFPVVMRTVLEKK